MYDDSQRRDQCKNGNKGSSGDGVHGKTDLASMGYCSNRGEQGFNLYPQEARVARIDGWMNLPQAHGLAEEFTDVAPARMNACSHYDTLTWRCDGYTNGNDDETKRKLHKIYAAEWPGGE